MTQSELRAAIARCDRELAEIDARPDLDTAPAYLIHMGREDWMRERRRLIAEQNSLAPEKETGI